MKETGEAKHPMQTTQKEEQHIMETRYTRDIGNQVDDKEVYEIAEEM